MRTEKTEDSEEASMDELISVIIPVYNSETYIYECLRSVMEQTYSNTEILVIDDGSTDHSREICNEISQMDERIRVLPQENKGVSAARNRGIREAKGKYLFFLDGDDVIHVKLLENLHRLEEMTGADIVTEYYCWNAEDLYGMEETSDRQLTSSNSRSDHLIQKGIEDVLSFEYKYIDSYEVLQGFPRWGGQGGIGGKLICRNAIKSVEFDIGLIAGEDTKFLYQLIIRGADAAILYKSWYYYRRHEDNVSKNYTIKVCHSNYKSLRYIIDYEKECGRIQNAVHIEAYLVYLITEWSKENRKINDNKMSKYLRELFHIEMKQELFSQVNWRIKKNIFFIFYCYPLYWLNCRISNIIKWWHIVCKKNDDR